MLKTVKLSGFILRLTPIALVACVAALICGHYQVTYSSELSQARVFGVTLRWESPSKEINDLLKSKISQKRARYTESWDPDCLWRNPKELTCPPVSVSDTLAVEKLANAMREETDGYFDIGRIGDDKIRRRDFSGLSQGLLMDELKQEIRENYVIDFAGDIYFSGGFTPNASFTIADPLHEAVTFAKVEWKSGWMVASSSRTLGQKIWNPKARRKVWKEDFQRVVLFGHRDFKGYRLDAWSTALIPGGIPLLKKLWSRPEFKGKWAYLYFDNKGLPQCSENLICYFTDASRRVVRVPDLR